MPEGDNRRYRLKGRHIESFDVEDFEIGVFDTLEAARQAMREDIIESLGNCGYGTLRGSTDPKHIRMLERIAAPGTHEDEFGTEFSVGDDSAWANTGRQAQTQWEIEEIVPVKKYILVETCERESELIDTYDSRESAYNAMKDAMLESIRTVTRYGDGDPEFEDIRSRIDNPDTLSGDEEYSIGDDSAWSNLNRNYLMDWNIFEIEI